MPSIDFDYNGANLINDAVRVLIIFVAAFILLKVLKRTIPNAIRGRMPRPRDISSEQIDQRADTISGAITKAISFVVWQLLS